MDLLDHKKSPKQIRTAMPRSNRDHWAVAGVSQVLRRSASDDPSMLVHDYTARESEACRPHRTRSDRSVSSCSQQRSPAATGAQRPRPRHMDSLLVVERSGDAAPNLASTAALAGFALRAGAETDRGGCCLVRPAGAHVKTVGNFAQDWESAADTAQSFRCVHQCAVTRGKQVDVRRLYIEREISVYA